MECLVSQRRFYNCVIDKEGAIITYPFENARYNGKLKVVKKPSQYILFNDNRLVLKCDRYAHDAAAANYDLASNLDGKLKSKKLYVT